jgi:uncharacterized protein (TIGR02145 family)
MKNTTTFIRQLGLIPSSETGGYGRLYNWYAANDVEFALTNWRVPTNTDFTNLITYLGGITLAGGHLKDTGFTHWDSPNTGADNSSNFTAYGSGVRSSGILGKCEFFKQYGSMWSSTQYNSADGYYLNLLYNSKIAFTGHVSKSLGYSIRLIYIGGDTPSSTITDYDGNVYDVIQIGTQYWTKQNWKCTHLRNGIEITEVTDQLIWNGLTSGAWCYYDNDPTNL